MDKRTPFPRVFWVANSIEVLERFAYYGIYFGFGIYMASLGYTRAQLGVVQSIFLLLSYGIPVIAGTFADRYGFKKVLIVSYLTYLPTILLLIYTKSFSGIVLTMLSIGLAAGIFKPLIAGTVRAVTDRTNKTLGFGIFYWSINLGAFTDSWWGGFGAIASASFTDSSVETEPGNEISVPGLSEQDMEDLAAWFDSQTGVVPPTGTRRAAK